MLLSHNGIPKGLMNKTKFLKCGDKCLWNSKGIEGGMHSGISEGSWGGGVKI